MKIVVYAIAKNEDENVAGFVSSAEEADLIIVGVDKNDVKTKEELIFHSCSVIDLPDEPFRFDHARNFVLKSIPQDVDVCISLDLDERLEKGWRKKIENVWKKETTRLHYWLQWSDKSKFYYDRIHARLGYEWRHANHEAIYSIVANEVHAQSDLTVYHLRDEKKDRSKNIKLLELAVKEEPKSARMLWYLAREYYYEGRYDESVISFREYLKIADWPQERAWARIFLAHMTGEDAYFHAAIRECEDYRDPYFEYAKHLHENGKNKQALDHIQKAVRIFNGRESFIESNGAYTEEIHLFHYKLLKLLGRQGELEQALLKAARINPQNEEVRRLLDENDKDSNLRDRER